MINKTMTALSDAQNLNAYSLYLVCSILVVAILMADMVTPLGVAIGILYIIVIWISFWSRQKSLTVIMSVICTVLTVGAAFNQPTVSEMWKVIFNRSLAVFAIWLTALLGLQRKISEEKQTIAIHEREKALEETRILRGLLPVCASCKKIRDDQGYWTQMETYIAAHSEADFSHSICPECAKKLYPEIFN